MFEAHTIDSAIQTILDYKPLVEEAEAFLKQQAEAKHTGDKKSGILRGENYQIAYEIGTEVTYVPLAGPLGDALSKKDTAALIKSAADEFPSLSEHISKMFDVEVSLKRPIVQALEAGKLPKKLTDYLTEAKVGYRFPFSIKRATIQAIPDQQRKTG